MNLTTHTGGVFLSWGKWTLGRGIAVMRLALVLSVSTLACATWGGSSTVRERENCTWQVCVLSRDGRTGRTYYVVNAGPVPATVTLTFRSFHNLKPPIRPAEERVVAAESTVTLAHLDVVVRGAPTAADASITIDLGASDTAPDEDYLYGIPFGGEEPRRLIQGFNGTETHREGIRYALDFAMPRGHLSSLHAEAPWCTCRTVSKGEERIPIFFSVPTSLSWYTATGLWPAMATSRRVFSYL